MHQRSDSYEYVLYIDEAGDDGLRKVKPIDENGSSEWLCIGAVLVRAEYELSTIQWIKDIRSNINAVQGPALHYRKLSPTKRRRACELLAEYPCRLFVVASNKKNMRGHRNYKAEARGSTQWFYNYCVRLLMERATDYCKRDSVKKFNEPRCVRVIFSTRGGHSYGQTKAYWEVLKNQAAGRSTFLNKREICYEVLRYGLVNHSPHYEVAGLQLADIVASAFYQAADARGPRWTTEPAQALQQRMAREGSRIADYGLVLQPSSVKKAELTDNQKLIFTHYGYQF
ncbi:DUF3800 domain-containing protein [Palleronia caenipelagi]|uniref:DUF3800 domain-containing protein n=1 Tax=Palleronia caenipelagi TaxID=2489174 RepID=A0A547Q689_9RHOB|nr:DUF3800 domain-containing protein [Palleronia caenipelagi]TRD21881.1 DUF3800 domain-containing protein [Palleronia caenipelagi]